MNISVAFPTRKVYFYWPGAVGAKTKNKFDVDPAKSDFRSYYFHDIFFIVIFT